MNLREQLKQVLARVKELASAAADRDLTDEEITESETLRKDAEDLREKIKKADEAAATVKALADSDPDDHVVEGPDGTKTHVQVGNDRREAGNRKTFGEAFITSPEYEAFRKEYPSGVGSDSPVSIGRVKVGTMGDWMRNRKATLDLELGRIQPVRMPMVDLVDRDRLTFLDLISRGQTGGNFEYVQVTGVTRNAAIVAEGELKPLSDMATAIADAKVFTYADGYDVTNQLLADAPAFASYMNQEINYSLDSLVEDKLLNGPGTSGEPRGLFNTTGVQEQSYTPGTDAKALVVAIRQAILKATRVQGGQATAVVLSPEDDAALDLLEDGQGRFYGQGPFGSGPATIWGRPRITSERLGEGRFVTGDFRQIALLDREGLSVLAFNQHKDYAQRNMTYVRAELRAAQVIWRPNRLVVGEPGTEG